MIFRGRDVNSSEYVEILIIDKYIQSTFYDELTCKLTIHLVDGYHFKIFVDRQKYKEIKEKLESIQ